MSAAPKWGIMLCCAQPSCPKHGTTTTKQHRQLDRNSGPSTKAAKAPEQTCRNHQAQANNSINTSIHTQLQVHINIDRRWRFISTWWLSPPLKCVQKREPCSKSTVVSIYDSAQDRFTRPGPLSVSSVLSIVTPSTTWAS